MKTEVSAGGIIFKRVGKRIYILMLKDKRREWTFPKGIIERGEEIEKTAEREIEEEVGLGDLQLTAKLAPIQYFYKWEGTLIKKTVHYFLFRNATRAKPKPQAEEGIMDVQWFDTKEVFEKVGYAKTNKPLLKQALEFIEA